MSYNLRGQYLHLNFQEQVNILKVVSDSGTSLAQQPTGGTALCAVLGLSCWKGSCWGCRIWAEDTCSMTESYTLTLSYHDNLITVFTVGEPDFYPSLW